MTKIWYEVWGKGPMTMKLDLLAKTQSEIFHTLPLEMLAKVRSPGLAVLVANLLRELYEDVEIR